MAHDRSYWEGRWMKVDYPWQRAEVDTRLKKYISRLTCDEPSIVVLVPLCGKTLDIPWLCEQGHSVVGVEFSEIAAKELFQEHSIPHSIAEQAPFKVYSASDRNLRVFVGDFFDFKFDALYGTFDAVWDCSAFGAAAVEDRARYMEKLYAFLKPKGRILLCNYEFDQSLRDKHPFSLPNSLIVELFGSKYDVELLESLDYTGTDFAQRYQLTWSNRLYHLLTRKS